MKRHHKRYVVGLSLTTLTACSSTSSTLADASGPALGCDERPSGAGRICTDYDISDQPTVDGLRMSCTRDVGTVVAACSHSGATGGCRIDISGQNGSSGTQTTWYYDITAAMVMSMCASGMFVAP